MLAGMIPKEAIVSTKRCEPPPTVRAVCVLMRLVIIITGLKVARDLCWRG